MLMFRIVLVLVSFLISFPSLASHGLIFDSEIDQVLKKISLPIFEAAGIDIAKIRIFILDDSKINAYASSDSIVINSGLVLFADDPGPLLGIIAHEIAHIAYLHPLRIKSKFAQNQLFMLAGSALGAIAALATGDSDVLAATSLIQDLINRVFLGYSREQERIADQAALQYLDHAGYSNSGLKKILSYIKFGAEEGQVYNMTHPLITDRISAINNYQVKNAIKQIPYDWEFQRVLSKLSSLINPNQIVFKTSDKDPRLEAYAKAIAYYQKNSVLKALFCVDQLLAEEPDDIYYNELKGGILIKAGKLEEAISFYAKAVSLGGDNTIIADYARVMMNTDDLLLHKKAVQYLESIKNEEDIFLFSTDLAKGYFLLGEKCKSYMILAEQAIMFELYDQARQYLQLARSNHFANDKIETNRLIDIEGYLNRIAPGS